MATIAPRELGLERYVLVGALLLGVPGVVTGFVIGLHVHAPTSWAAAIELGLPATFVGSVLGLVAGGLVALFGRLPRSERRGTAPR